MKNTVEKLVTSLMANGFEVYADYTCDGGEYEIMLNPLHAQQVSDGIIGGQRFLVARGEQKAGSFTTVHGKDWLADFTCEDNEAGRLLDQVMDNI